MSMTNYVYVFQLGFVLTPFVNEQVYAQIDKINAPSPRWAGPLVQSR